jgi:hypothetical protein
MSLDGTDGPYGTDGDCEHASTTRAYQINGPGSAGEVDSCYDADAGGAAASSGGGLGPVRPVALARFYLSAVYGGTSAISYQDGTTAVTGATTGGALDAAFGRQVFGYYIGFGADRTTMPATALAVAGPMWTMWTMALHVGLHSSPFRILRRSRFELRPELAVGGAEVWRLGCDRCSTDPADIYAVAEPGHAFAFRAAAGLDFWLGAARTRGVAVVATYQRQRLTGDPATVDPRAGYISQLVAPTWMVQLSFIARRANVAAE